MISTHAPLAGRDIPAIAMRTKTRNFNPRAPCGARRNIRHLLFVGMNNFNPRAPCGARPGSRRHGSHYMSISTHAPLAGRDQIAFLIQVTVVIFQPTRPLRGATLTATDISLELRFQPTRPLRGATQTMTMTACRLIISTHAPLAGRDDIKVSRISYIGNFNPRAPCGARLRSCKSRNRQRDFNPRAPCGARPDAFDVSVDMSNGFQPTRPLRGATARTEKAKNRFEISTHAPLAGRDSFFSYSSKYLYISTHAPLAGRDRGGTYQLQ